MKILNLKAKIDTGDEACFSDEEFFMLLKKLECAKNIYSRYDLETGKAFVALKERLNMRELRVLGELVLARASRTSDIAAFSTLQRVGKKFFPKLDFRAEFLRCAEKFLQS